jgi:hypothetical protein
MGSCSVVLLFLSQILLSLCNLNFTFYDTWNATEPVPIWSEAFHLPIYHPPPEDGKYSRFPTTTRSTSLTASAATLPEVPGSATFTMPYLDAALSLSFAAWPLDTLLVMRFNEQCTLCWR